MKLAKTLILALGLMTLAAAASFANVNFISSAGHRIIAVNSQTGETSTITLSATGPEPYGIIPAQESIFLTYDEPISALGDIVVSVIGDSSVAGALTCYGPLCTAPIGSVANVQVGLTAADMYTIQIRFLQDVTFYPGDTISIAGVRVDVASGGQDLDLVVMVDFSNAEGEAVVTNGQDLEVAEVAEPISVSNPAAPPIQFLADGTPINDVATITISELFTNAFETKPYPERTRILLTVTDIPAGVGFVGVAGLGGTASAVFGGPGPYPNSEYVDIDLQNASNLEDITVGLQFELVSTPDYAPSDATVTATLAPPLTSYPSLFPLRYAERNIAASVPFGVQALIGGRLLAVFNATDTEDGFVTFDTGIAIMNGSGTAGLPTSIGQAGTIVVNLYPMDGSGPYSFETSADDRPGLGLDEFGRLVPRGTWAVLLSQLLEPAGIDSGQFTGFIIFSTDFPNAEGVNYLSDFEDEAQGYQMINLVRRDAEDTAWYQIGYLYEYGYPMP